MHSSAWLCTIFLCLTLTQGQLQVSIYYESLCPDSLRFITTQLYPTYPSFANYLRLDLVPFGKATASKSSGHWKFRCQHGPRECYNNKIHTCVIAHNPPKPTLNFINCAMKSPDSPKMCAIESGISWNVISNCLNSGQADVLLAQNGDKTNAVTPPIDYVPTIIFNGVYRKAMQNFAEKHFAKSVCSQLKNQPHVCKKLRTL
ncbi:GILT-like protein 1 [Tribolium castaneum]|uniref:GILT-like protein 1 n=1 Tax=Tribolium castaneum TaxID=7070 RepID=UPI0030FEF7FE